MDCATARGRLPALAAAELGAADGRDLRRHLAGCAACRRVWAGLDPVGAADAYGQARAPADFAAGVQAALAARPAPRAAAEVHGRLRAGLAAAALLAVWATANRTGPLAVQLAALWAHTLFGALSAAALALRVAGAVSGPALTAAAAGVVLAELAVLHGWMRTMQR